MSQNLTVQHQEYRTSLKLVNAVVGGLDSLGFSLGKLERDSVLRAAQKSTKLEDWGDESFLLRLERLLDNAQKRPLTPLARVISRQAVIKALSSRLRIEQHIKDHPEVLDVPIQRPLFILGFPRTGTTLLQNLLSLPSSRKALEFWELTTPYPVHRDPEKDRKDRIRRSDQILKAAYFVAPEMAKVHAIQSHTPEECWPLFFNTFAVMNYDLQSAFTEFGDWLLKQDMVGPYREYRRQLQILTGSGGSKQFVLKCPEHLWFLDALLEVFPDACVVWTHRDPVASIASYSSLISLGWRMLYGRIDPGQIGGHISDRFFTGVNLGMEARQRARPGQFFDVDFQELVADPVAMVRRIHAHFQLEHPVDMDGAVETYLSNERADARGKHRYSAAVYGLDVDEIHRRYSKYIDRFNIPLQQG